MLRAIRIRPGRPVRAMRGHPWAFLGEIEVAGPPPADGDCVELTDPKGRSLGAGLWNGKSQIAWRRYSRRPVSLDGPLLEELITAAVRRRGDRCLWYKLLAVRARVARVAPTQLRRHGAARHEACAANASRLVRQRHAVHARRAHAVM